VGTGMGASNTTNAPLRRNGRPGKSDMEHPFRSAVYPDVV